MSNQHSSGRGLTRRDALKAGALTGAFALSGGATAFAGPRVGTRDVLLLIFLRGGMDGLSVVVPYQDDALYKVRPTLGVRRVDVDDLDGMFGLSRTAAALLPLYNAGDLAFVHAVGSLNPSRSHFEAMRRIEQAAIFGGSPGDGWLARHLNSTAPASPLATARGIAIDRTLPDSLKGGSNTIATQAMKNLRLGDPQATKAPRAAELRAMLQAAPSPDGPRGLTSLALLESLESIDFETRPVAANVTYPSHPFGRALYESATLIQSNVGVEAIEVDYGGWDHHTQAGPLSGSLSDHARTLSEGLGAFMTDLGPLTNSVTVMVMSEFGRRVDENGSNGFDHGRGGLAMVLGGDHVAGGRVYGDWPGLQPDQQDDKAVAVTTDLRNVIGEVLERRLQTASLGTVLPNFTPSYLGIVS